MVSRRSLLVRDGVAAELALQRHRDVRDAQAATVTATGPLVGRFYLERGAPVKILVQWGLKSLGQSHGGPRNVLVLRQNGTRTVRPFRGLRVPHCRSCADCGTVCENHPDLPWDVLVVGGCDCGGAGMPCPGCCSPIPMDGRHSIVEAFVPDRLRPA
jgi:hypothetical protein